MNKPGYARLEKREYSEKSGAAETSYAIITAFSCRNCDRNFRARIGLISYIRTHPLHATDQGCHDHHLARHDPRHGCPQAFRTAKYSCSTEERST